MRRFLAMPGAANPCINPTRIPLGMIKAMMGDAQGGPQKMQRR